MSTSSTVCGTGSAPWQIGQSWCRWLEDGEGEGGKQMGAPSMIVDAGEGIEDSWAVLDDAVPGSSPVAAGRKSADEPTWLCHWA